MSEKIYDVSAEWAKRAWVDQAKYREMYAHSISDPNGFWAEQGKRIGWIKPFTKVENASFAPGKARLLSGPCESRWQFWVIVTGLAIRATNGITVLGQSGATG